MEQQQKLKTPCQSPAYPSDKVISRLLASKSHDDVLIGIELLIKKLGSKSAAKDFIRNSPIILTGKAQREEGFWYKKEEYQVYIGSSIIILV